jgi:hypothetical protein
VCSVVFGCHVAECCVPRASSKASAMAPLSSADSLGLVRHWTLQHAPRSTYDASTGPRPRRGGSGGGVLLLIDEPGKGTVLPEAKARTLCLHLVRARVRAPANSRTKQHIKRLLRGFRGNRVWSCCTPATQLQLEPLEVQVEAAARAARRDEFIRKRRAIRRCTCALFAVQQTTRVTK